MIINDFPGNTIFAERNQEGCPVEAQRAEEISRSREMVDVLYNGEKVYIEHVDKEAGVATVHPLNDPYQKMSVPVESLKEK